MDKIAKAGRNIKRICEVCQQVFFMSKARVLKGRGRFCTLQCMGKERTTKKSVECDQCKDTFYKDPCEIKRTKNNFCSRSCGATYKNTHKKYGTRKSKLECWLEIELLKTYPNLDFIFNGKKTIESELDIYIPDLKLAFEIQGIFHYKPIFGENKLKQIQENDLKKVAECKNQNIALFTIDASSLTYLKDENCEIYKINICNIINKYI